MGIVEEILASAELSSFDACYIESNADGSIHLHLDDLRIELSRREFDQFAAVVRNARSDLREIKNDGNPIGEGDERNAERIETDGSDDPQGGEGADGTE